MIFTVEEVKKLTNEELFDEFRSIYNFSSNNPEVYANNDEKRNQMRIVSSEMRLRKLIK